MPHVNDKPLVTVAIPTYNRVELLAEAVKSVLDQDLADFELLIVDDGSTDSTGDFVAGLKDARVRYLRNDVNLGYVRTWMRALREARGRYFLLLPDDDKVATSYLSRTTRVLQSISGVGFCAVKAIEIDLAGNAVATDSTWTVPEGVTDGSTYLESLVLDHGPPLQPAMVVVDTAAARAVGGFDPRHSRMTFDWNLWIRLAANYDVAFLHEELAFVRIHEGQVSEAAYRSDEAVGRIALVSERMEAGLLLLGSPWAEDDERRRSLSRTLTDLSGLRSMATAEHVDDLNLSWSERTEIALYQLDALLSPGVPFVFVGSNDLGVTSVGDRRAIPFTERDGVFWGEPVSDAEAIAELERHRANGITTVVFGWSSFWWLTFYEGMARHIESNYDRVIADSFVQVYTAG